MKVLIFGSRSLTWKHLPVFRAVALHSLLDLYPYRDGSHSVPPLSKELVEWMANGGDDEWPRHREPLVLLNGDGPPGKGRGAIGADKIAVLACMETWPEKTDDGKRRRHVRWFPPEPKRDAAGNEVETWGQAAARRDVEMAEERPDRSYCIHTDLDSSKGSIITADALRERHLPFWFLRVTSTGELVSVEQIGARACVPLVNYCRTLRVVRERKDDAMQEKPEGPAILTSPTDPFRPKDWDSIVASQFAKAGVPVRESSLEIKAGGCTERGLRSAQEDGIRSAPEHGVFAVADGISDGGGGDAAAEAAVACAVELAAGREGWSAEKLCVQLASEADTAVRQAQSGHWGRCQTTLALLVLRGNQAAVAWCGDSRVYRLRDGRLEQLTEDHRYGRHVLSKWLGARNTESSEADFRTLDLRAGDAFLLVTDGVGDTLPEERIRALLLGSWVVRSPPPAPWGAESFVQESLQLGSRDNCTALVVLVGGASL